MTGLEQAKLEEIQKRCRYWAKKAGIYDEAAEDLASDVIVCLLQQQARNLDIRDPVAYAIGIFRKLQYEYIRQKVRRNATSAIDENVGAYSCNSVEHNRLAQELLALVCERERTILWEFYMEGRSWQDIALDQGMTATQFRLYKTRLLARVRRLMARSEKNVRNKRPPAHTSQSGTLNPAARKTTLRA